MIPSDFQKKQEARRIWFTPVKTLTIFHNGSLQPRADNCSNGNKYHR